MCSHFVGSYQVDLKPCRAAKFLFGGDCNLPSSMKYGKGCAMVSGLSMTSTFLSTGAITLSLSLKGNLGKEMSVGN